VERSFSMQKKALELTAEHTKAAVDAARRQLGMTGTRDNAFTDKFRRGVDALVDAQKKLLEWYIWKPTPRAGRHIKVLVTLAHSDYPIGLNDTIDALASVLNQSR
jgi:hypothetical protein